MIAKKRNEEAVAKSIADRLGNAHALVDLALQKLEALQLQYVELLAKGNE